MDIPFFYNSIHAHLSATNFAHVTTAELSYNVQDFVAITSRKCGSEANEISIVFGIAMRNR